MKRLFLIICFVFFTFLSNAQPRPFPPERMSDEDIVRMQIRDIVSWLDLEGKTKDRFVKEYTAFRKEIDEISKKAKPSEEVDGESDIDAAIQHNFAVSEQILQLRKKYYFRFKEFLQPSQIQMMYRIENEAGQRMQGGPGHPGGPDNPPAPPLDDNGAGPRPKR